ncbi:MAG: hypothetical protein ABIG60_05645 [Patescibacteria group bacterium]
MVITIKNIPVTHSSDFVDSLKKQQSVSDVKVEHSTEVNLAVNVIVKAEADFICDIRLVYWDW